MAENGRGPSVELTYFSSIDDIARSSCGVGVGLYFKLIKWMFWMMMWMAFCSVPYLVTINSSVFTDYLHRHGNIYGVKVFESFELASWTFAPIVDDRKDNGTLQYMYTDIGGVWKGPMMKGVFLTWISAVDMFATAFLTVFMTVMVAYVRRWLRRTDHIVREVSDYTILVCGLPISITKEELINYFNQMVFKRANHIEDRVVDAVPTATWKVVHQKTATAFVTFNTEHMRAKACKLLPSGWWSSLFMSRNLLLKHNDQQEVRLWVRPAAAPNDYCQENMSTRARKNIGIQFVTGIVASAIILLGGVAITYLSAYSNKTSRLPKWDGPKLFAAIRDSGGNVDTGTNQSSYNNFCSTSMGSCTDYLESVMPATDGLNMTFGYMWSFPSGTAQLLNERPMRQELVNCAKNASCPKSYCLPCYCLGLRNSESLDTVTAERLHHVRITCSSYFKPIEMRRDGLTFAISYIIAVINVHLMLMLSGFKYHVEKHWSFSDADRSFAIWFYVVKLINSIAVLLVVNSSTVGKIQKRAIAGQPAWVQRLVLGGLYDDFTPEWYVNVGGSIMVLMMIQLVSPMLHTVIEVIIHKIREGGDVLTLHRHIEFTLEERIANAIFNVTLALLFGSGMPLCYLLSAAYLLILSGWDRVQLITWKQRTRRCKTSLPMTMMYMLPVLLLAHCAFGMWMHTYFRVVLSTANAIAAGMGALTQRPVWSRITQPNGLPLLIWLFTVPGLILVCFSCFKVYQMRRRDVEDHSEETFGQAFPRLQGERDYPYTRRPHDAST